MEPNPTVILGRHWNLILLNRAVSPLLQGVSSAWIFLETYIGVFSTMKKANRMATDLLTF
jgi:hypothetical protein